MNTDYGEEYVLGDNITELARGKKSKESVVVSVRLTAEEFYRLEKLCENADKSMSQLVRDALAAYQGSGQAPSNAFGVTLFDSEGTSVSVGPREYTAHSCYSMVTGLAGCNLMSSRQRQMPEPGSRVTGSSQQSPA